MKTPLMLALTFAIGLPAARPVCAQDNKSAASDKATPAAKTEKPAATPEKKFKALFTKAYLSGRWAPLKDGVLGEEKRGDNWSINAKLKYREPEFVMPIPATVKFAGDAAILVVDNLPFA